MRGLMCTSRLETSMALSDDEILSAWAGRDERFMRPVLGRNKILTFGRAIEAEVQKQDTALIRQLVEALESVDDAMPFPVAGQVLKVARARLEGKP